MRRSLLIYDGSVAPFRAVAERFAARVEDLRVVEWDSERVQAFLQAQFDGRPFAFILVEGESVHVGGATISRLLRRRGAGEPTAELGRALYAATAAPFGRVVHGQEPADIDGTFSLTEAAADRLAPLRTVTDVDVPVRTD
ncbi:MAG: hypothetical protein ABEJ79_12510 [Halolamina sp.]